MRKQWVLIFLAVPLVGSGWCEASASHVFQVEDVSGSCQVESAAASARAICVDRTWIASACAAYRSTEECYAVAQSYEKNLHSSGFDGVAAAGYCTNRYREERALYSAEQAVSILNSIPCRFTRILVGPYCALGEPDPSNPDQCTAK